MRVFVTGATGFVGRALCAALHARGDQVVALSRGGAAGRELRGTEVVVGDLGAPGEWQTRVAGCDAVVHLAGESIAGGRLDEAHRARIMQSRVDGTRGLVAALMTAPDATRPRVLVAASGVDYYPFDDSDRAWPETGGAGETFLAQVCAAWESAAHAAEPHGVRVVCMRTALVLDRSGGALAKMIGPFKLMLGGPLGSGRQWFSWVSLADAVGGYLFALRHDALRGAVNLVSPDAIRQKDFARALGRALHRPAVVPTPAFALRAALGGVAEYALHGRRVVPAALARAGYAFRHADVSAALSVAVAG